MRLLLTLAALLPIAGSDPLAPPGPLPPAPLAVDDFACLDQHGVFHKLSRQADARLVVLYVFAAGCPIVRQNARELQGLMGEFAGRGVRFFGLDPASQDDRTSIAAEAQELGLTLPVLLDDSQTVAEMLEVTRTAEALVISTASWQLLWRGPLDDRLEYGAQREDASRPYLREALEALLGGRTPPADVPRSKGCAITFVQPRAKHEVDYARDVAPLLAQRCQGCHREGGIGPWAMDGYERVRGWSAMMRDVLLQKRMVPWQLDPLHGRFRETAGLTPEELRTILHWIERGAPRGDGEDPLARELEPLPAWPLGPPDVVVELPEQELPATGLVPYRILEAELELPDDRWVRAVDLRPSNPEVLHHGFAFLRGQQEADMLRERLYWLDAEHRAAIQAWLAEQGRTIDDPPPEALALIAEQAFQGRTYFAKYVPGHGVDEFPAGTGKRVPAHAEFVFQLHYATNGAATSDRPRLGLYFHDEPPPRELRVGSALQGNFVLEPGERHVPVQAERLFERECTVFALSPHMHYRGRSMRFTALFPDGRSEILLSVPEYVFDWQATYTLAEPRVLPAGTRIVCDGVFDNSAQNEHNPDPRARVRFGQRTQDEMFFGYVIYSEE